MSAFLHLISVCRYAPTGNSCLAGRRYSQRHWALPIRCCCSNSSLWGSPHGQSGPDRPEIIVTPLGPPGIVTTVQISVYRTGAGAPSPPPLREVDSPKAKTEGVSYRSKGHSPSQKSKIFASPLKEGAKGSFTAELPDKFQFNGQTCFRNFFTARRFFRI